MFSDNSTAEDIFRLDGLQGSAEILIDECGVPHIYAGSFHDAFFVQGFNAARDRLWQIDFWRRRGLGRLAEVFGPAYAERDRAARLFLYRGSMHDEWLAYGSDTKRATTAYVAGVNAWIQQTREDPSLLSPEFHQIGYVPDFWAPEDVARIRSHGLFSNLREEVARALTVRDFGSDVEELRRQREPATPVQIPEGLDLDLIPDDVLDVYELATTPPQFPAGPAGGAVAPEGSNNWVVGGARTATGRPLLANDPHRGIGLPGLRYIAHLSAPEFDVIGAGEPVLPGISIGHNGHIAFGLTIFAVDQEDLYVYRTNPDNPYEYWYRDRWEPFEAVSETISVADDDDAAVELLFTRHGPVIYQDPANRTAFAVRAAWLHTGMAPYLGSMDYMQAKNQDAFVTAMNRWGAPPENQVYADTSGAIGWKAGGLTPVRPNWYGTMPVPGDGRFEWDGFYDVDQLPGQRGSEQGFIATANEMNLPQDYPPDRTITHDWYAPYRKQRIDEVLTTRSDFTVDDMAGLHTDTVSIPARRIIERLRAARPSTQAQHARALLEKWDADLRPNSAAAALFEVWYRRHLRPALLSAALGRMVPADQQQHALQAVLPAEDGDTDARVDLDLLDNPGRRFGDAPDTAIDQVLHTSLAAADAECARLLGDDRSSWQWGSLHTAAPQHPLAARLSGLPDAERRLSPLPRGGSGDTVDNTAYLANFEQFSGASFRIVVDVGNWDGSVAMNSPGQSGDPRSRHYDDLFQPWAHGDTFPLLYSRAAVLAATEQRIVLHPAD